MAAPKARGRAAALAQLQEKRAAAGGAASSAVPESSITAAIGATTALPAGAAAPEIRTTFAERVGDVKSNVERARQEYRSRTEGALGHLPSAGPSASMAGMHQRFANLEMQWGEVMDSAKIDPLSTSTPGVSAAASHYARNKAQLDDQVDAVLHDLWEGVSGGHSKGMTEQHKDRMMEHMGAIRGQPGGQRPGGGGYPGGYAGNAPRGGLPYQQALPQQQALALMPESPDPYAAERSVQFAMPAIPDNASRRELEEIRNEVLRLEQIVEQAVLEEENPGPDSDDDLPPPPPLVAKHPQIVHAENKAAEYQNMYKRIVTSDVGAEGDSGSTPCNSVDDPTVPVMLPPKGGMNIQQQVRALEKEVQKLRQNAVQEVGSVQNARKLAGKQRGRPVY